MERMAYSVNGRVNIWSGRLRPRKLGGHHWCRLCMAPIAVTTAQRPIQSPREKIKRGLTKLRRRQLKAIHQSDVCTIQNFDSFEEFENEIPIKVKKTNREKDNFQETTPLAWTISRDDAALYVTFK